MVGQCEIFWGRVHVNVVCYFGGGVILCVRAQEPSISYVMCAEGGLKGPS